MGTSTWRGRDLRSTLAGVEGTWVGLYQTRKGLAQELTRTRGGLGETSPSPERYLRGNIRRLTGDLRGT